MSIIDLSLTIDSECMTCGTPWHQKVIIEQMGKLGTVGRNTSRFVLGSHTATHMDAPLHFIDKGYGIEKINLDYCVGLVNCVDFRNITAGEIVTLDDVKKISVSERMLFVFGWCKNWKTSIYYKVFPYFTTDAVKYLISAGMKMMAMDTPSPDAGGAISELDDSPNHKMLLNADTVIVEYLCNTERIDFMKQYEIIALPLKILNADGSPARVILREV